ncbi:protein of unknown function (plasmid) [Streptantibioticus cattleyicolor NRRL 8057 = DSM 46488]|nr:protein of unknown function [Streptantibioticus cattleyicolor NRRL 8057 = DSM 46488]
MGEGRCRADGNGPARPAPWNPAHDPGRAPVAGAAAFSYRRPLPRRCRSHNCRRAEASGARPR